MIEKPEAVLGKALNKRRASLAVAESCTGGLISHRITNISGSSAYFERGIVAYSNKTKIDCLGVPEEVIKTFGAVSPETAIAMASGIMKSANTTFGLAVTGIAGPGGGTEKKPVGLVYIAVAGHDSTDVLDFRFEGDREAIKEKTANAALTWLVSKVTAQQ